MRLRDVPDSLMALGVGGAMRYWFQRVRAEIANDQRLLTVTAKDAEHPLVYRANTSDRWVFRQIFVDREFSGLNSARDVGLVIDCGANAGFSSAYFLSKFPSCEVIAVEPDLETYRVLRHNLLPYGDRAHTLNSAVWSHRTGLKLVRDFGDGEAWSVRMREVSVGEARDVDAVDIGTLLQRSGYQRVSLLKVDIEGAEAVVFDDPPWLNAIDNIVIELHENSPLGDARGIFFKAIDGEGFSVTQIGERTICRRRQA